MIDLKLPSWLQSNNHIAALSVAFTAWWALVQYWLELPLRQFDARTCHPAIVQLLAWQRDIQQFKNEPENLYRLRVYFAAKNLMEACSVAGFSGIFERLNIGSVQVLERQPDVDWDVVFLQVPDSEITANSELMQFIIQAYGRTCRRYSFLLVDYLPVTQAVTIDAEWQQATDTLPKSDIYFTDDMQGGFVSASEGVWHQATDTVH